MKFTTYEDIGELYNEGVLIARIKLTDGVLEIFPTRTTEELIVMVRGNGFDYDSKK